MIIDHLEVIRQSMVTGEEDIETIIMVGGDKVAIEMMIGTTGLRDAIQAEVPVIIHQEEEVLVGLHTEAEA